MKKLILIGFMIVTVFSFKTKAVLASKEAGGSADVIMEKPDLRIARLKKFLDFYNSPLTPFAAVFVKTADKYNLDWKLIPAITGVESTFGKAIPFNSYNAYGWVNGEYYFKSWEESIETVAKHLRNYYYNRGADTVDEIAPIYAPPSSTWAWKVKYFMSKLENFTPKSTLALELSL